MKKFLKSITLLLSLSLIMVSGSISAQQNINNDLQVYDENPPPMSSSAVAYDENPPMSNSAVAYDENPPMSSSAVAYDENPPMSSSAVAYDENPPMFKYFTL